MAFKDRLYRLPVIGTALRVQDRYKADAADQLAASLGFFGFLSLFPLMILALSVVGFVLAGDPTAQADVVTAIVDAIPGFGATLEGNGTSQVQQLIQSVVTNRGTIGVIGFVTLVLAGLRVVNAAMTATTRVFRLPLPDSAVKARLQQAGGVVMLGVVALVGVAAGASVGIETTGPEALVRSLVGTGLSFGLDLLLFLVAYRVLSFGGSPSVRKLLPGAILGAVGWTALKVFGATWVTGQIQRANALYGTLGGVIALLLLLYLAGRLYLYGAELIAVTAPIEGMPPDLTGQAASGDRTVSQHGLEEQTAAVRVRVGATLGDEPAVEAAEVDAARAGAPVGSDGGHTVTDEDLPIAPSSDQRSPAITAGTDERLRARERERRQGSPDVRGALALLIAAGAVGALVRIFRPWELDDDE